MNEEKQRAMIRQEYQFAYHQEALADSIAQVAKEYKIEMGHQAEMSKKNRLKNVLLYSGIFALLLAGALWSRIRWIRKANARLEEEKNLIEKERQEQAVYYELQGIFKTLRNREQDMVTKARYRELMEKTIATIIVKCFIISP